MFKSLELMSNIIAEGTVTVKNIKGSHAKPISDLILFKGRALPSTVKQNIRDLFLSLSSYREKLRPRQDMREEGVDVNITYLAQWSPTALKWLEICVNFIFQSTPHDDHIVRTRL